MKIIKGDKFVCIKKVKMETGEKKIEYIKGKIYKSEHNGCITDESFDIYHGWSYLIKKYFIKLKE